MQFHYGVIVILRGEITMRITYLFDPLYGWCYGASPVLEKLARHEGVTLHLAPAGLFAGDGARKMDAHFADYAWQNDQRIARLTGQIFSETYRKNVLGKTGGRFDSMAATLGLIAVRLTSPSDEFAALKAIQLARYVDGLDNSSPVVVADILEALGLHAAALLLATPDDALLTATHQSVAAAQADMRQFEVEGIPALVVGEGQNRRLLRGGVLYGSFGQLLSELAKN